MEINTNKLHKGWKIGETVRIINQTLRTEKQYYIVDCYPEFFPRKAILEEIPLEERYKECNFRIIQR